MVYMVSRPNMIFAAGPYGRDHRLAILEHYRFSSQTNRKLTRFLESVKYSDSFGIQYRQPSRPKVSRSQYGVQEVLEAFRKHEQRKKNTGNILIPWCNKCARYYFLMMDGSVQLINTNAKRFLGVTNTIKNISELKEETRTCMMSLKQQHPGRVVFTKKARSCN